MEETRAEEPPSLPSPPAPAPVDAPTSAVPPGAPQLSVRSPKSPLKPLGQWDKSPYLLPAPNKSSPKGKGSHISTIKSLGLLHDLQVGDLQHAVDADHAPGGLG